MDEGSHLRIVLVDQYQFFGDSSATCKTLLEKLLKFCNKLLFGELEGVKVSPVQLKFVNELKYQTISEFLLTLGKVYFLYA